jgi:hypothetical protein
MMWSGREISGQQIHCGAFRGTFGFPEASQVWEAFVRLVAPHYSREELAEIRIEFWGDSGRIILCPYRNRNSAPFPSSVLELFLENYQKFAAAKIHSDEMELEEGCAEVEQ